MAENTDPYYNRKPVPNDFLEHVGPTGLSKEEEYLNRERKYSANGSDVRKFFSYKSKDGGVDPHYARKQVPDSLIKDVGITGLTPEEEFLNRERKYSQGGGDIRKFSSGKSSSLKPSDDPYYGRKSVNETSIIGVGDTGYSKAEEYEVRERKQSMFQESADPFQQFTAKGHRQSVSGIASAGAADARRRSSAVGPHTTQAMANHEKSMQSEPGHAAHSGFAGETLAAIESRTEQPPHSTTTTTTTTTTTGTGNSQHGLYHDNVTYDQDSVAPHEVR